MWVVNYAAPGVAIAGIGMTYYALMKQELNLERENQDYTSYVLDIMEKTQGESRTNIALLKNTELKASHSFVAMRKDWKMRDSARPPVLRSKSVNGRRAAPTLRGGTTLAASEKFYTNGAGTALQRYKNTQKSLSSSYTYLKSKFDTLIRNQGNSDGLNAALLTGSSGSSGSGSRSASSKSRRQIDDKQTKDNVEHVMSRVALSEDTSKISGEEITRTLQSRSQSKSTSHFSSSLDKPRHEGLPESSKSMNSQKITAVIPSVANPEKLRVLARDDIAPEMKCSESFPSSSAAAPPPQSPRSATILDFQEESQSHLNPLACSKRESKTHICEESQMIYPSANVKKEEEDHVVVKYGSLDGSEDEAGDTGAEVEFQEKHPTSWSNFDCSRSGSAITVIKATSPKIYYRMSANCEKGKSLQDMKISGAAVPRPINKSRSVSTLNSYHPNNDPRNKPMLSEQEGCPRRAAIPLYGDGSGSSCSSQPVMSNSDSYSSETDSSLAEREVPSIFSSSPGPEESAQFLLQPTVTTDSVTSTCVETPVTNVASSSSSTFKPSRPLSKSCNFLYIYEMAVEEILTKGQGETADQGTCCAKRTQSLPNVISKDGRYGTVSWEELEVPRHKRNDPSSSVLLLRSCLRLAFSKLQSLQELMPTFLIVLSAMFIIVAWLVFNYLASLSPRKSFQYSWHW